MIKINLLAAPPPSLAASLFAGRTFVPLLVAAIAISASLFPAFGAALELRPERVAFEPWRLLTGHLAHWNEQHLLWDLLVFLALAPLLAPRRLATLLLASGLAISFGVLICHPELDSYRGLSGIDAALYTALAIDLARRESRLDRALGGLALLLFAAKVAAELAGGRALFVATGGAFVPVPLAHLLGFAAALFEARRERIRPSRSPRRPAPGVRATDARAPARRRPDLCHNAPR